jgi:hypothetical protein
MRDFSHGAVVTVEQAFTVLSESNNKYLPHLLIELVDSIRGKVNPVKDSTNSKDNLWLTLGYAYFGQFIDMIYFHITCRRCTPRHSKQ